MNRPRGFGQACALFLVRAYQQFLSPLMPLGCRYYPTCSHYAAEAIEKHGAWQGIRLGARRILRCHPFAQGGFDPVPGEPVRDDAFHKPDLRKEPAR